MVSVRVRIGRAKLLHPPLAVNVWSSEISAYDKTHSDEMQLSFTFTVMMSQQIRAILKPRNLHANKIPR